MTLLISQAHKIVFTLEDTNGAVVTGLGATFTVEVSKAGAAFAAGTGAKAEIGDGWYSYVLSALETNTIGDLAVMVTGSGAAQKNLTYEVSGISDTTPSPVYATLASVRAYLGAGVSTADDDLITNCIARAQKWIDSYCRRTFQAAADATRYFEVGKDTQGGLLMLDADLCAITSIANNLDNGSGGEVIPSTEYRTEPRNTTPYWGIRLKSSSAYYWRYTADAVDAVSITGRWAYSTTAPADITQACVRLAAYLYRQKDAQVFDVTAQPEMGVITIPQGMPKEVKMILDLYRKAAL